LQNIVKKADDTDNTYEHLLKQFSWDDNDLKVLLSAIDGQYNMGKKSLEASYLNERQKITNDKKADLDNMVLLDGDHNLLWSWSDNTGKILMETKLGISIDI